MSKYFSNQQLRLEALDQANRYHPDSMTADDVVNSAKAYYTFLSEEEDVE